jgi:hypothetical protein
MTTCAYCAEEIDERARVCPHCRSNLSAPPPSHSHQRPGDDAAMRMLLPVGRSGWAIAAGYLGLFSALCVPAPIAVIVSLIAIWDLKHHPEQHGWGRAVFGLVMGILGSLVLAFGLIGALLNN